MIDIGLHPAFDPKILRRKATFLLHAFEHALYAYACNTTITLSDLPAGVVASIQARVKARGVELSGGVAEHLENAYLDEIFDSAISANRGSDCELLLKALKERCLAAGVFEIRNACAHPAREFPVFYWYRVASVAADPLISLLRLQSVYEALISAEDDRISDPPAEWLARFIVQVPNNLPSQSEHDITGLIGREKELSQLVERLASVGVSRLALTGYGGIGKTALALQALQRICFDPTVIPDLDGVVYVTLKAEQLTADGIVALENAAALQEIRSSIHDAIRESGLAPSDAEGFELDALASKRLIVCIDNAESLIKSDEATFNEFLDRLPATWKIVLTSRLTVDGARTLPISPLGKSHSEFLARRYISARNLSADSNLAKQVGLAAKGNPLCVRLIVDKICLGVDVADAISIAGEDLVRFSFTSLLEVLPTPVHRILEALYLAGSASRAELSQLLELDDDVVVESIRLLQKTSLISTSFSNGYESLSLNDAVSDLLMNQPLLSLAREEVREQLRIRSQRLQTQLDKQERMGKDSWDFTYIPTDSPIGLKTLLIEANTATKRSGSRERLISIAAKLANAEASFASDPYYWKARGRVLDKLGDPATERIYRRAMSLASPPGTCAALLAQWLGRQGQAREVIKLLSPLIDAGTHLDMNIGEKYRRGITYNYVRAMRDLDRFKDVVDFCEETKDSDLWGAFSPFWISSLRQDTASGSRVTVYSKSIEVTQQCVDKGMHSAVLVEEVAKLLESLSWDVDHGRISSDEVESLHASLRVLGPALLAVRGYSFDPLRFEDAYRKILPDTAPTLSLDEVELVSRGFVPVSVERIPSESLRFPSFLFFRSDAGEVFFCHRSSLSDTDVSVWNDLHVGDRAFILPGDTPAPGEKKLRSAISTVIFSD